MIILIPLPPRELSPNSRADRYRKAEEAATYRQLAAVEARNAWARYPLWEPPSRARLSFLFRLGKGSYADNLAYHPEDADNALASCKALLDGLRDAGIIFDDSWEYLEIGAIAVDYDLAPGVQVRVESAPPLAEQTLSRTRRTQPGRATRKSTQPK